VPSKDEYNDPSEDGVLSNVFCPVPHRRGETIYLVQFLHQTVKTFSLSAYRATELTSRYSLHDNGHAYIARYFLALLFHHSQSYSDVQRRFCLADGEKNALTEQNFWGRYGAFNLIEALAQYVPVAESKTPKVLLSSFVESGDDRISDLFYSPVWTEELGYPPLTSVSAYAVVYELCELLDALLEQSKRKALFSSPPLLHLAVEQLPLFSFGDSKKRSRTIRILLDHGANAREVFDEYTAYERLYELGMSDRFPFLHDLEGGMLAMVLPFLEAGQDSNVKIRYSKRIGKRRNRCGEQCILHYAASSADTGLITALLEHSADVNAVDEAGSTPFDCVCDVEGDFITQRLSEMVDLFLQQRAFSPLNELLHYYLEAASLLVSRGARFGVSPAAADDKFLEGRKPLTRTHIDGLKSRGTGTSFRFPSS